MLKKEKNYSKPAKYKTVRKASTSLTIPQRSRHLLTTLPRGGNKRVWSRHLIFLGNQETVDKELYEILGKLSVTRGEDGTPPRRPSEEGTQTDFGQFTI